MPTSSNISFKNIKICLLHNTPLAVYIKKFCLCCYLLLLCSFLHQALQHWIVQRQKISMSNLFFLGDLKYKLFSSEMLIQIFGNCLLSKKVMCDMCAPKLRNVVIYCGLRCVAGNSFPIPTSTQNGVSKALPTLCCYRAQHIVHVLSWDFPVSETILWCPRNISVN